MHGVLLQRDAFQGGVVAGGVGQPFAGGGLLQADAVILAPGIQVEDGHVAVHLGAQVALAVHLEVGAVYLQLDLLGAGDIVQGGFVLVGGGHNAAQRGKPMFSPA